jgi:ABC-type antimicrobial peptide transport system permease subunit
LFGAFVLSSLLSTMLFRVEPTDAFTYLGAIVLIGLVTVLASYFPARRAAQIDPSVALRQE